MGSLPGPGEPVIGDWWLTGGGNSQMESWMKQVSLNHHHKWRDAAAMLVGVLDGRLSVAPAHSSHLWLI